MFKYIGFILLFLTMFGFRMLFSDTWKISEADPTLWIKFCDKIYNQSFLISELPDGDPLIVGGSVAVNDVIQSVLDDYNNVTASYMRLAEYPADPSSPGAPLPGDSAFTLAKASQRTINVCFAGDDNPFRGGHASPELESGYVIGCNIVLIDDIEDKVDNFIETLTHELGHCLGFGHPQETRHSIMSYYNSSDSVRLRAMDKMGLVYAFPRAGYDLSESPSFGLSCDYK
jgi:hypothetical protein